MEIKEDLSSLSFLDCKTKFILATGLGGTGREYKAYKKVFREENVEIIYWDESCIDIDSHLKKLKRKFLIKNHLFYVGILWVEC
ncbi:MAG: hypothetical protein U9O98_05815 [Asgard group archaeon]|nr:hypothetical protein [Asgard group archaeon]